MPRVAVPLAAAAVVLLLLIARSPAHAFQQNVYLSLPWEGGATWRYSTGPHGPSGIPEALDLQPPDAAGKPCELFTSSFWVVASAPGTVIDVPNAIEIDHGNGFHTGYYHLQDKQVHSGHVEAGTRLGKPGCCPDGPQGNCLSSAPHLHFYTSYNGARQDIHGLNIGGWTVDDDGCLARGDRRACPGSALVSEAPAAAGVQPLDIDVALVLHAAPGPLRTQAVASYLAGVGPKERVAVIESAKQPRVLSPLGDADRDGRPSEDIARSSSAGESAARRPLGPGIAAACKELDTAGRATARAVFLVSDAPPADSNYTAALTCLEKHRWPVFAFSTGSAADRFLLQALANETGGRYQRLTAGDNWACAFQAVRARISGNAPPGCSTFLVLPGEFTIQPLPIPPGQQQVAVTVRWNSARSDPAPLFVQQRRTRLHLFSPSGARLADDDEPANGIRHDLEDGFESYTINEPASGEWTLYLSGADVLSAGEYLSVSLTTVPIAYPPTEATSSPEASPGEGIDEETPTPLDGATPTPLDGISPSSTATPDDTASPTNTGTPTPLDFGTPTPLDSATPAPIDSGTPTPIDSETPTPEPSPSPTAPPGWPAT